MLIVKSQKTLGGDTKYNSVGVKDSRWHCRHEIEMSMRQFAKMVSNVVQHMPQRINPLRKGGDHT